MFKLLPEDTIRRKLEIPLPYNAGEKQQIAEVYATFKIQPKSVKRTRDIQISQRAKQAQDFINGKSADFDMDIRDLEKEFLLEDVVGLEGVVDPDTEEDIPFSPEILAAVLDRDYAREVFLEDWRLIHSNKAWREAEKAKN